MRFTRIALFVFFVLLILPPATGWGATTYTWNAAGGPWTNAVSWTPNRNSPSLDDILVFPALGGVMISGIPNQTVGQVIFAPGAYYFFQGASTLTIIGGAGTDFDLPATASLTFDGTTPFHIGLASGATGRIGGEFHVSGAAHQLFAVDAGAITVANGGQVFTEGTFTGNLFGTTNLNSVVFQSGSTYQHGAGSNPFGASQPNSVVVFEHGSLFRLVNTLTPSMSGRTYANFEYDNPGNVTAVGSFGLSIDSITVKQGFFKIGLSAPVSIRGSITVGDYGKLRLGPTTGSATYTFNGAVAQNVDLQHNNTVDDNSFDGEPGTTLAIDNPAGLRFLYRYPIISCTLQFVHGILTLPSFFQFWMELSGQGQIVGASQSTGWVLGRLKARVRPQAPSRTFDVGDSYAYAPVTVTFHGLADSMDVSSLSFSTLGPLGGYPYYTMAQIDSTKKVNRVWAFYQNKVGAGAYSSVDVTVGWDPSDVDPGADPSQFVFRDLNTGRSFSVPYRDATTGARSATFLQALGITPVDDPTDPRSSYFINVGEPATVGINAEPAAIAEGAAGVPRTKTASGATLTFPVSILPASVSPVSVDYSVVDGSATAASGDYTPVSGTLTFAPGDTVKYVDVPIAGDATPERNETIQLDLANPSGGVIATPTSTGTLLDDDDVTPPSVAVLSPNGGETGGVGEPLDLQWNATDDVFVSEVDLEVSRDGGATYETVASGVPNTGTYTWTSTGPSSTQMLLRVTAKDDPGHTAADVSDAVWALSDAVAADGATPKAFALSPVAPNPARGTLGFRYALPKNAAVQLDIVDVRGRIVTTLVRGEQQAGEQRATWATSHVASGLYFACFRAPGFEAVQRFVVMK